MGLNWTDHGWRFFDSQIGRWHVVDPLAEEEDQESWSPYHFGYNNPIRYNDLDGRAPGEGGWDTFLAYSSGVANAMGSNMAIGNGRLESGNPDFQDGQRLGDRLSLVQGTYQLLDGGVKAVGGTVLSLAGGVGIPIALAGGVEMAHGGTVLHTALKNINSEGTGSSKGGNTGKGKNHLEPDKSANGPHSTFKREGGDTGPVKKHAEYSPNSRNPSGFDEVKRTDLSPKSAPHTNKKTGQSVPTPHTQGKNIPGGVRPATPNEMPKTLRGQLGF